ncbi:MAG: hypothetical protein ACRC46_06150 [Thermoguttaceae bacterium]
MTNILSTLPPDLCKRLDSLDARERRVALDETVRLLETQAIRPLADPAKNTVKNCWHNLHCHSFFSYNGYGFSPTTLAVLAKLSGWRCVGMVDFDVLDGADEFFAATAKLGVPSVVGMETRVFVPELADAEVNSPGEPGIVYHLGMCFSREKKWSPFTHSDPAVVKFATMLRENAAGRIRKQIAAVNDFFGDVRVNFETIARTETPCGNITERHLCRGYRLAAAQRFQNADDLVTFWMTKLGKKSRDEVVKLVGDDVALEGAIRTATMKSGGVAYLPPTPESFPTIRAMNDFIVACGAVPAMAWLNGLSAGEADPERLLDIHIGYGARMLIIIPDRNFNVADDAKRERLVSELGRVVAAARSRRLPIIVGTEMNAPGQKFVDSFDAPSLAPFVADFVAGADAIADVASNP